MKLFSKILFFAIFSFCVFCSKLNLRKEEPVNVEKTPTVKIHMEDMDRDPINYDRFASERKLLSDRIAQLYYNYSNDRKSLLQVLLNQQQKVEELINISSMSLKRAETAEKELETHK